MLNITNHRGNAKQTHYKMPLPVHQEGYSQGENSKYWRGCGEVGTPVRGW